MSAPLVYFLTFVTYGSWLHGDDRGSVDVRATGPEDPREQPNVGWRGWERAGARSGEVTFDARFRFEGDSALRERCAFAGWHVLALNVRTNHVHMVISAELAPERVLTLKSWATRRLVANGLSTQGAKVWARHVSTRYLWSNRDVEGAVDYVLNRQGPTLSMDPG
ncbi:MAG: hypothetical protein ABI577_10760 [bacterium]